MQATWGFAEGDAITAELTALRKLGGGSAYEAWLAFDEITWLPVVVKVLRPDQVADERSLQGLRREARALERLNHPVTVRGLRHEAEGERPHLVLEQVDGPRLSTLVRKHGPLQPAQYLPLAIDVASALHYFGRMGWVHLDVKPSNVIMGAPARLIDLSVARPLDDAASLRQPVGTDAWMAPEQCAPGEEWGVSGSASDVWGLGATLFHAVTGQRPFAGKRGVLRLRPEASSGAYPQLVGEPGELPRDVPGPVAEIIRACLQKRPEDRPLPAEVTDALEPVLAALPRGHLAGFRLGL